jgi:hypothetical protein
MAIGVVPGVGVPRVFWFVWVGADRPGGGQWQAVSVAGDDHPLDPTNRAILILSLTRRRKGLFLRRRGLCPLTDMRRLKADTPDLLSHQLQEQGRCPSDLMRCPHDLIRQQYFVIVRLLVQVRRMAT